MEFSVRLTASGQCFKLNLSLIIFFQKSRREGGLLSWKSRQEGVLVLQEIQVRGGGGGLKNGPIRRGVCGFFLE